MNVGSKWNSERGATMIEHALLICLIAIIASTAIPAVGENAVSRFNDAAKAIDTVPAAIIDS